MRPVGLVAIAAFFYAAALIVYLPASVIDARLQGASDGRWRLAAAHGSVWTGGGQLVAFDGARRVIATKDMAWQLRPRALLQGQLRYEVELDRSPTHIAVTFAVMHTEVSDADITLPAAALSAAIPQLAPFELGGELQLHVARLSILQNRVEGEATVQWRAARSALTPVQPLGDYELTLKSQGAVMHGSLRTLRGPLELNGNGTWTPGGAPALLVNARVVPQFEDQLRPLLRLIAFERSAGNYELTLR
jgi:general secretion pathway protein N